MKLQIAFDSLDLNKSLEDAKQILDYCDIIQIGSLLIFKYGIKAIEEFKNHIPKKTILVDSKIIDKGQETAQLIFNAGADWLTVMAGTNKDVIHDVCTTAHDMKKKVMLDLTDAASLGQSALDAKSLGVDAILFKQTFDETQPHLFIDKWEMVKSNTNLPIFVNAKIKRNNIEQIVTIKPDGLIIGKAITQTTEIDQEAKFYYNICCSKK